MADKKVNVIISLKDGVSAGLQGIRNGISATADAFKKIAVAGMAAGATIVAGFTAIAKAFAESEAATNKLASTFTALGEDGKQAAEVWGAYATSIQKITTLDDEVVMGLVSTAKVMGVSTSKIKEATEGAIGLSKAFGMDLNSAMKMTVMAMEGEYGMLSRYIPALRSANSEAEKAAIVQRAMATGWNIAKDELKTVSGSYKALKNSISDAMEAAGEAVFGNGGLSGKMNSLKESITKLTESGEITFWANEIKTSFAAVADFLAPLGGFFENIGKKAVGGIRSAGAAIGDFAGTLASGGSLKEAWNSAGESAKNAQSEFEARKAKSVELIQFEKQEKLAVAEAVAAREKELAEENALASTVKKTQGGFAELYKKMSATGSSEYEKEQFTRFVAGQENVGAKQGVSGAGKYAANLRSSGISEYDVIQKVQDFIKAEMRGMAAGVSGVGAFATQLAAGGAGSYDINNAVTGMIGQEQLGAGLSGGLSDPLAKTNELLTQQNAILQDRLGGVE